MPPDLSDELREEVVLFLERIETAGLEQTRPCSLSSPKIVISEWRLSTLRHVLPRFALDVLCHSRTATPVVPMVPERSQKWARPLVLGPHRQSNETLLRQGMKGTLGNHGPRSVRNFDVQKMFAGDEGTFSQRFFAKSKLHTFPHTPRNHRCRVALVSTASSDRHAPRKHQSKTCSNDLYVMHSSSGTMLLDGLFRLSKAQAHFHLRYRLHRLWLRFPSCQLKPLLRNERNAHVKNVLCRSAAPTSP